MLFHWVLFTSLIDHYIEQRMFYSFRSSHWEILMMMMMMMMMKNCVCGMVDRWKAFSLISNRDHCQISSPSRISDTPWEGFEPAQNLSSGLVEWGCAIVIMATVNKLKYVLFLRKLQAIDLQNRTSSLVFFKNFIHTNTLILFEEYLFFFRTLS